MPYTDQRKMKKWIRTWDKAALSLKDIKRDELRSDDYYEKNRKRLDEMLEYACKNLRDRPSSGLVEQQRLFMKFRKRLNAGEKI